MRNIFDLISIQFWINKEDKHLVNHMCITAIYAQLWTIASQQNKIKIVDFDYFDLFSNIQEIVIMQVSSEIIRFRSILSSKTL